MCFEYDPCNLTIIQSLYNFYANYAYVITCQAIYQAVEESTKHKWGIGKVRLLAIGNFEVRISK